MRLSNYSRLTRLALTAASLALPFVSPLYSQTSSGRSFVTGTLSPERWPDGDLERFRSLAASGRDSILSSEGMQLMIAATGSPVAVRAGYEALRSGGSAVDAALTNALAQITLSAGCCTSFAGVMHMLYYEAATGKVHALDADWNTVLAESDPGSIPTPGTASGRSAYVPGFMAGLQAAHDRFGQLPFAALFEPSIYFAEQGFLVPPWLSRLIEQRKDVLTRTPEGRAIFARSDGDVVTAGDLLKQPALAETLRNVAARGADFMYTGPWADSFVEIVAREGGHLSKEDLSRYGPMWVEPVRGEYDGHVVHAFSEQLLGNLYLAEAAGIPKLERPARSAESLFRMMGVFATATLVNWPDSLVEDRLQGFHFDRAEPWTKQRADSLWHIIETTGWPGSVPLPERPQHSSSVVAVDTDGNIAVVLHTINTFFWGTTGIFVDGVSISDYGALLAQWWDFIAPDVRPGDRSPLGGGPGMMMAFRNGRPRLASAAVSNPDLITLQSVVRVLSFGMTPADAGAAPHFYGPTGPADPADRSGPWDLFRVQGVEPGGFPNAVIAGLESRGIEVRELPSTDVRTALGWAGVSFDPSTGRMFGGRTRGVGGVIGQ